MPPKVLHCNVREWIKSVEEEIAGKEAVPTPLSDAIGNLCLDHRILHRHGVGVTILFPVDHEYRMSLYNDSLSSDDDVYTNTVRRISALIMPERVTSISGLARNESKGDFALGSRNGYKYIFTPDGSTAKLSLMGKDDKVIDTGCTVSVLKTNCRFSEIAYASAFALTVPKNKNEKGGFYKLPYEYLEKRQYQMKPAARVTTGGSAEHPTEVYPQSNQYLGRRVELAKLLEFKYAACCASGKKECPYLVTVVSLLNYLRANRPDVYADVLPILDVDPFISFYILVEPYRQTGHMLSDTVLYETGGIWEKMCLSKDPKTEYIGHLNNEKAFSRSDFSAHLATLREDIIEESTYQGLIAKVRASYNSFVMSGSIGGQKVLKSVSSLLTIDRKIWQDEFRMHFSNSLQYVCGGGGKFSQPRYDEVIRSIQYCWPANDYASEVILNRQNFDPKTAIVSRAELAMLRDFIYSSDFLYVCPTTATVGHEVKRQFDDSKDYTVYNRNYHAFARLEAMSCDNCASLDSASAEIAKTLASL